MTPGDPAEPGKIDALEPEGIARCRSWAPAGRTNAKPTMTAPAMMDARIGRFPPQPARETGPPGVFSDRPRDRIWKGRRIPPGKMASSPEKWASEQPGPLVEAIHSVEVL